MLITWVEHGLVPRAKRQHPLAMKAKPKLTKTERDLRDCMLHNTAGEIAYRYQRYHEALNEGLADSIRNRRHRELIKACEGLIEVGTSRLPDAYLRYAYGEAAVRERDKLLGLGADVVPIKRSGRPL